MLSTACAYGLFSARVLVLKKNITSEFRGGSHAISFCIDGLMFCSKCQAVWFGFASNYVAHCVLLKVGRLSAKPERDVLMQDFAEVETVTFPR